MPARARPHAKTRAMAFAVDYLRRFPDADYMMVRRAAQFLRVDVPGRVQYRDAVRALKKEAALLARLGSTPRPTRRGRRRGGPARGIQDLAALIDQMEAVFSERDRLRSIVDEILAVVEQARGR